MTLKNLILFSIMYISHYGKNDAQHKINELLSFSNIWGDVIDANLEDLDIRRVTEPSKEENENDAC